MRVLVIEDQLEVSDLVRRALERDGHLVSTAASAAEADECLAEHPIDVVVLDLGLPDESGLTWCRRVRSEGAQWPILVLTAQSAVHVRVEGLDAGADDFLAKPFAVAELRARVRALGRRGPVRAPSEVTFGTVRLEFATRRAELSGREVPLTQREWKIVELLSSRNGRVVPRAEILDAIWGDDTDANAASLEVIVGRIRRKLGMDLVRTVRGEGYAVGVSA